MTKTSNITFCISLVFTAPSDYIDTAVDLSFSPSETEGCASITIVDDTVLEGAEQFTATLQGNFGRITLEPNLATVTIGDNDRKKHQLPEKDHIIYIYIYIYIYLLHFQ